MSRPIDFYNYRNVDSLSAFLKKAHQYPMLNFKEELKYIKRWQKSQDTGAIHSLVSSHIRLVARLAGNFRRYGLSQEDLISEGCVGLVQAINRFDASKGFRLSTYAKWWIRAAMQEYIMRSWSLVRIGTTVGQKKLFFNLRRLKSELSGCDDGHLSGEDVDLIMDRLKVARHEVLSMESRLSNTDSSLNEAVNDEDTTEWMERIVDPADNQEIIIGTMEEHEFQRNLVDRALNALTERERTIFITRRIDEEKATLGDLGQKYKISPERVRQIEHCVFDKVQIMVTQVLNEMSATH